jgi:hypothetical protein
MNTITARKELIDSAMKEFEKDRDYAFVAGFYASLIREIALDKLSSTQDIIRTLKLYKAK